jgi:hypothetical protein
MDGGEGKAFRVDFVWNEFEIEMWKKKEKFGLR